MSELLALEPKQVNPFKAKTISKLLIKFSAPAVAGMFVNAFYNIISRIFIGNEIGSLGIAGVSIAFPVGLIFMAFSMLIGVGGNALFSIRLGEKREEQARHILGNTFISLIIFGAVLSISLYFFIDPVLVLFGANEEILPYAKAYTAPSLIGLFFFTISLGLNYFIRSSGHPKTAMGTQLIGALINLVCAPIYIFVFKWGMTGAALAVVTGQVVSFFWVILFFLRKSNKYRLQKKYFKLNRHILGDSMKVGLAQFIFQISGGLLNVILNHSLIKYGGSLAVSAAGIVVAVNTIVIMPILGISQGTQPLVGYNYGAKKYRTSIQTVKMAIRWGLLIAAAGFIIIQLFPREIVSVFNKNDEALINLASKALRIFNLMLPTVALPILTSSFFQAINKPMKAAFLSLSRQVLILIPMVILLPCFLGLEGVFYAGPVSDLLSATLAAYLLKRYFKKYKQNLFFKKDCQKRPWDC